MELEPTVKHTKFTEKWHGNQYLPVHFFDGKKNIYRRRTVGVHVMKIKIEIV